MMAAKKNAHARKKAPAGQGRDDDGEDQPTRRALWSGSISFGLLQIPVSLHTAEQPSEIQFHQLDRRDLSPIHYERVNAETGKPVAWKDIARGYEHSPGQYVIVEDRDLAAANVEATQTIDLQDFVDVGAIFPSYFERPYLVAPGKRADKAYALFRDALERKKVVAVGSVVIRTRQHLCAILPQGDALVLELLRFAHEIRDTLGLALPKDRAPASARELAMAEELIDAMRSDWEPSKYKDQYRDELLALIERKAKTGKVEAPAKPAAPRGNVVDLMAILQKSLEARGRARAGDGKRDASKGAARRRTRAEAA
jgi:DNA end-binding protein Ku